MNYPLVSILVPVYQVEKYIERCSRSLFEQTYENLEFVFIDDCTSDSSMQVLEEVMKDYPDRVKHVNIIRHSLNRGIAATRNELVDKATGEFVVSVDSDDWIERNAIELLLNKQQETNADIVSGRSWAHYDEYIKESFRHGWNLNKTELLEQLLRRKCSTVLHGRLIRRSLYTDNNIRCDERGCYAEDFQIFPRLVYYSMIVAGIDAFLYHYECSNRQALSYVIRTRIDLDKRKQDIISKHVITEFLQDKEPRYRYLHEQATTRHIHHLLRQSYQEGNRVAFKYFRDQLILSDHKIWHHIKWNYWIVRVLESRYHTIQIVLWVHSLYHFFIKKK